jgi:NitT/TauT family transport system ATP-binding protein
MNSVNSPIISVRHLKKTYVDEYQGIMLNVIEDLSFEINQGEFVSILGPSGCGKTTVLNILAGFVKATAGSIVVDGQQVVAPGPDRGVVFQSFALFPWKTALQNVAFGLKVRGIGKAERERIAREHLRLVGLEGAEGRYPHELSGGMQQRVGVARVLASNPKVMLMDEPFASVDAQTRVGLQQDLTRIWETGRPTIFFVTHDVDEAVFLSDRIIVLAAKPGRIREIINVNISRPRRWETLLEDNDFRKLSHRIFKLLGDEATAVVEPND